MLELASKSIRVFRESERQIAQGQHFKRCCKLSVAKISRNADKEFVPVHHIQSSTCSADSRKSLIPMVAPRIVEALLHSSRKRAQTMLLGYEKNQSSAERGRLPGRVAKTTLRINRDSSRTGVSDIAHQ